MTGTLLQKHRPRVRRPHRSICTVSDTLLAAACQHLKTRQPVVDVCWPQRWRPRQWSIEKQRFKFKHWELGFEPEVGVHDWSSKNACARERSTCSLSVKGLECWTCGARLLGSFANLEGVIEFQEMPWRSRFFYHTFSKQTNSTIFLSHILHERSQYHWGHYCYRQSLLIFARIKIFVIITATVGFILFFKITSIIAGKIVLRAVTFSFHVTKNKQENYFHNEQWLNDRQQGNN